MTRKDRELPEITPEIKKEILAMGGDGINFMEIASKTGVWPYQASNVLRQHGISEQQLREVNGTLEKPPFVENEDWRW